jgi:hypothetical protein
MLMALRSGSYLLDDVDELRHYLNVRVAALRLYPHRVGIVHPLRRNPQPFVFVADAHQVGANLRT